MLIVPAVLGELLPRQKTIYVFSNGGLLPNSYIPRSIIWGKGKVIHGVAGKLTLS